MRKMCIILLLFAFFGNLRVGNAIAYSSSYSGYAKVLSGCVLYKNENLDDKIENVIFTIPESYFVFVLENVSTDVLKVQYGRFVGYVKSSKVVLSTFVPIVKTLDDVTCDIKQTSGTQIWNTPSASGLVLTTVSADTKGLKYIASCVGVVPTGGQSDVWFYVCYTPEFNSTYVYEGYVYSENITNISTIVFNLESNPEVLIADNDENNKTILISSSLKTILIVLIAVPIILLILIILYKLTKKISKNTNKTIFDKNNNCVDGQIENENINQRNLNFVDEGFSKFKNLSFVKRRGVGSKNNYPEIPSYESEDDWL